MRHSNDPKWLTEKRRHALEQCIPEGPHEKHPLRVRGMEMWCPGLTPERWREWKKVRPYAHLTPDQLYLTLARTERQLFEERAKMLTILEAMGLRPILDSHTATDYEHGRSLNDLERRVRALEK